MERVIKMRIDNYDDIDEYAETLEEGLFTKQNRQKSKANAPKKKPMNSGYVPEEPSRKRRKK